MTIIFKLILWGAVAAFLAVIAHLYVMLVADAVKPLNRINEDVLYWSIYALIFSSGVLL